MRPPPRARRRAMLAPMRPSPTIPISMNGFRTFEVLLLYGLSRSAAMARHDGDCSRRMASGVAFPAQARGGLLGLPRQQRAVDRVGLARPRLGAGQPAVLPRGDEYPRRLQERVTEQREPCLGRVDARQVGKAAQPGE